MSAGKSIVVAGATGSVGRLIVQTCLRDQVTAVVRKTLTYDKVRELWDNTNLPKLTQVEVDYLS